MEGNQQLSQPLHRRAALVTGLAALALPAGARTQVSAAPLRLDGRFIQGGVAIGQTTPGANVFLDAEPVTRAGADGWFVIGFDRDAPARAIVRVAAGSAAAERTIAVQPGDFDIQRINGLPQNQVAPTHPALLARIRAEGERKRAGFASQAPRTDFREGFISPLATYRLSGRFGGQRILNGVPARPHYGVDMAAPRGTPILAPAGALVCFAESGLHYEGGLVMLDHGQGLITAYLHMSRLDVSAGQTVSRGQVIGAVGAEGRATGPHLCWRMKWRDRNLNPMSLVDLRPA
ncbi:M23 family metallopeptidase [Phenylobacterium sp.]|uniref:M23 family metallopeptidase n=1 Tax=Phenylobacterium sp. TaxID=1871053 RepID=UPI00351F074E